MAEEQDSETQAPRAPSLTESAGDYSATSWAVESSTYFAILVPMDMDSREAIVMVTKKSSYSSQLERN